jgi:hypothetical protein
MDIIGAKHPFFEVAWRRYATVAVSAVWAIVEWTLGSPFWGVLSTGVTCLAAYELIYAYKPKITDGSGDAKP